MLSYPPPAYHNLLDNLATGVYYRYISKDGIRSYLFFNRVMKELFGNTFVPASKLWDQELDDSKDTTAMTMSEPLRTEFEMLDKNGQSFKWLIFFKSKVELPDDPGACCIVTTVIDVTGRKREELLLAKSRMNLKIATDAGHMSTWDLDAKTMTFTITNGVDIHQSAISLEEHIMLRHHDRDRDISHSDLVDVLSGKKEIGETLYMMMDPDSREILYRKSHYIGIKTDGVVKHVIGSTQDVTELYRQKQTIEENRDELNLALEAGSIAAWTYDVAEKMFRGLYGKAIAGDGMTAEQVLDVMHPDDRDRLKDCIDSIITGTTEHAAFPFRFKATDTESGYRYYDSHMKGRRKDGKVYLIIGTQRDITDEYIHQEQMEEFTMKANLINEATNSVFWDYDIDRHVLLTYSEHALMPFQPITLEKYLEYVHPKDRVLVSSYFTQADSRSLDDFSFEIDLLLPGRNTYSRIIANGIAVKNGKGDIVKYTGVRKDVSEIANLNRELNAQNILKDTVVNNVFVGLILLTPDYKVVWANEYASKSFSPFLHPEGCTPGTPCEKMMNHFCTRLSGGCFLRTAMDTHHTQTMEFNFGDDRCLEATAIPVMDSFHNPTGALLKLRDITERNRVMNELNHSRQQALETAKFSTALMDKMPSPIFIVDPGNDFKIVRVNQAFCTVFSLAQNDVLGKTNAELFGPATAIKYDTYDKMIANGSPESSISYEAMLEIDNEERHWLIHKSILVFDGRKLILSVSTDISELKKMNKEVTLAKDKALQADKLKTAFLANMSHEIRTPLNAIVGFSDLLGQTDDKDEKHQYISIIQNNTQMLLRLISDILDLSKIEAGNTDFKRDMVEVSSYFNELTASLALKVTNPEVTFIVDNPYHTCYINMDKMRFGQVITNFVTNAIKYTHKGYIKVGYYIERHGVTIRVEDTGVGIPPEKRSRVFTRFDKLDSNAQGTGLGLSIAKVLTENGGGKIWFESEEGVGTTFFAWKPFTDIRILDADTVTRKPGKPEHREKVIKKESTHVIRKILVAEDNESNYLLPQKILTNYEIEWVQNGIDAIDKVAKSRYDVVLMDIKMPIMDGLDATRQIRKFNSAIPIVAVTANAYAVDKDEALRAGCNDFLAKPIMAEDVYSILKKI